MRTPDFIIVGAARSGTTALHRLLGQHPEIYMTPNKEPCFFAFADRKIEYRGSKFAFAVKTWNEYCKLFSNVSDTMVAGEASTPYLFLHGESIAAMQRYLPESRNIKIVMILRNPAERAFSNYVWRLRDGREDLSFDRALAVESQRMEEGYSFDYFYSGRSLYYEAVKGYLEAFDQVHIILYDDFVQRREETLKNLCRFLGVDDSFHFRAAKEVNNSYVPRFPVLSRIVTAELGWKFKLLNALPDSFTDRLRKLFYRFNAKGTEKPEFSAAARKRLAGLFNPDIDKLSALIGRDLSAWKS